MGPKKCPTRTRECKWCITSALTSGVGSLAKAFVVDRVRSLEDEAIDLSTPGRQHEDVTCIPAEMEVEAAATAGPELLSLPTSRIRDAHSDSRPLFGYKT